MCSATILRPALPKMSPTKRMFKKQLLAGLAERSEISGQRSMTYLPWNEALVIPPSRQEERRKDGARGLADLRFVTAALCFFLVPLSLILSPRISHQREQDHVANRFRAGENHGEAIDSDTFSASWGQSVRKRAHVVF